ncbi:uncharacterized protein N7515_001193 [Penicillium bovifimosum]|uniref:Uncharacterized protein n=1 Tax=Penicillium bovifimosum TaxID=126998 RepID=A0A9W9HHI1_9EURO|nr:uncharacterized protein N7515_001193 [Penicillium bovifimosum]KAJ5146629.1 hypothetical protein N7515_001193 [Penicillium bovifimosum]
MSGCTNQFAIFKSSTIKLGYRLTGLWPYNPIGSIPADVSTPTTTSRFRRIEKKLDQLDSNSSEFQSTLQKLMKGSQIQAHLASELRRELSATTHAQSIREPRRHTSGKSVRLSGIISSEEVYQMKRQEKKLDDLEALHRLRPQWKKVMKELKKRCIQRGRRLRR